MTPAVTAAPAVEAGVVLDFPPGASDAGPPARPAPLSLRRNFSWTLAGNLAGDA